MLALRLSIIVITLDLLSSRLVLDSWDDLYQDDGLWKILFDSIEVILVWVKTTDSSLFYPLS